MSNTTIDWPHFEAVDMRAGTILQVTMFPEARKPAYKLLIDFGPLGIKKSSAQITTKYSPETLLGMQVIAVVNFPNKQIGPFISECLVLGVYEGNDVILLQPQQPVSNGSRIG